MKRSSFRPTVYGGNFDQNVFDIRLGVLDVNIEVAAFRENSGIEEFELLLGTAPPLIFLDEPFVGKLLMRVCVEHPHVTVRGSRVEIKVILFYVFAMISLIARQTE